MSGPNPGDAIGSIHGLRHAVIVVLGCLECNPEFAGTLPEGAGLGTIGDTVGA